MITLNLTGGLGNQMFQYAAGLALARKHATELIIDTSEFDHYGLRDYQLGCYALDPLVEITKTARSKFQNKLARFIPNSNLYTEPHYHFDPRFWDVSNNATIQGYFQSELYFKDIETDIRQSFKLKKPLSLSSEETKQSIKNAKTSIALHVRRGDYVSDAKTQATHGSASEDYYKRALALMKKLYGDEITIFIFSDDTEYVSKAFGFCKNKVIVSDNDDKPHEDMTLMSYCDHIIIANSSFSWWGAWLNDNPDKTVIAPKNWFAKETQLKNNTIDLIPEGWITL